MRSPCIFARGELRQKQWRLLIECVKDFKSSCEFNSVDSDKVRLYEEVRKAMASHYEEKDFGPKIVRAPPKSVKDMTEDEYKEHKSMLDKDKGMIRVGYNRIKEKLKCIRQDYSKAVVAGTRNGSGKIVIQYFDDLGWISCHRTSSLWCRQCKVECSLPDSTPDEEKIERDSSDSNSPNTSSQLTSSDDCDHVEEEQSEFAQAELSKEGKVKGVKRKAASFSEVPRLIDNKRKQLEKRLTSAQRDQKLLEAAKEDTLMRKEMMDYLKESSRSTALAIENMSQTSRRSYSGHNFISRCFGQTTTTGVCT